MLMCDAGVIDTVAGHMVARRHFIKTVAAGAAVTGGLTTLSSPVAATQDAQLRDLTHVLHEDFPTFFGEQQFFKDRRFNFVEHRLNLFDLRVGEHTGTHIDAPLHFSEDGPSVAEIPVSQLVVPLCVIDIRARAAGNADAQLTPDDLNAWIEAYGPIPENACVAMNSGWAAHVNSDHYRNVQGNSGMHFPGFHVETVAQLLEETTAVGIAVDTLSLDYGQSQDFAVHTTWLPAARWGLESLANLDDVPPSGATLIVGAAKHRGGTGGQARVFAWF